MKINAAQSAFSPTVQDGNGMQQMRGNLLRRSWVIGRTGRVYPSLGR